MRDSGSIASTWGPEELTKEFLKLLLELENDENNNYDHTINYLI